MLTFEYDTLDSTSDRARSLCLEHPGRKILVTAVTQTNGRGRSGRRWVSPTGGAWFSLVWPACRNQEAYKPAPLVVGLALHQVISGSLNVGGDLKIKWPNDLLLDNKKVAGILCEHYPTKDGPAIIIGVGINTNFDPRLLGDDLLQTSTTLNSRNTQPINTAHLIQQSVQTIARLLSEFETRGLTQTMLDRLHAHLAWMGQPITVTIGDRESSGVLMGLTPEGNLMIDQGTHIEHLDAGEVRVRAQR